MFNAAVYSIYSFVNCNTLMMLNKVSNSKKMWDFVSKTVGGTKSLTTW